MPPFSLCVWAPAGERASVEAYLKALQRPVVDESPRTFTHSHTQTRTRAVLIAREDSFRTCSTKPLFWWNLCGTSSRKNPDPSVHWCLTGTGNMSQVFNKLFGWIIFTQNVFQVLRPAGGCDSTTPKDLLHTLFANPFNYQSGNWVFFPSSHQCEHRKVMRICTWPPAFSCRCSGTVTTNAE